MAGVVLSRRAGQSIRIGADIVVTVTELHRSSCKLRVEAPKELLVLRAEVEPERDTGYYRVRCVGGVWAVALWKRREASSAREVLGSWEFPGEDKRYYSEAEALIDGVGARVEMEDGS